jgi:hypothetical protein
VFDLDVAVSVWGNNPERLRYLLARRSGIAAASNRKTDGILRPDGLVGRSGDGDLGKEEGEKCGKLKLVASEHETNLDQGSL